MRDDIVLAEDGTTEASRLAGHGDASWIYIFSDTLGVGGLERPIKTGVSLRRFPVPQGLLDLGFADYVRSVPPGQWLLPMPFPPAKPKKRALYALNALGDYRKTTLGIMDEQCVTYSFRHTVADEVRVAGIEQEVRDKLLGHTEGDNRDKNAGELYYGALWHPAKPLLEAASKLFPVLLRATVEERGRFRISASGLGIHWPDLDEDISLTGLLGGRGTRRRETSRDQVASIIPHSESPGVNNFRLPSRNGRSRHGTRHVPIDCPLQTELSAASSGLHSQSYPRLIRLPPPPAAALRMLFHSSPASVAVRTAGSGSSYTY